MKPTKLILDFISRGIDYNPTTGLVGRKKTNTNYTTLGRAGYILCNLTLDTKHEGCSLHYQAKAHQIAWYLTYHEWPETIDHINGVRSDNRLVNLRSVTQQQNMRNKLKTTKKTTSQYKGVALVGKRWRAYIETNSKKIHLGYFATEAEAAQAYNAKAAELFGEYASLNTITP